MLHTAPFDYTPPDVATHTGHEPETHFAYGTPNGAMAVWTNIVEASSSARASARVGVNIKRDAAWGDLTVGARVSFEIYHYLDCYKFPFTGGGSHSRGRLKLVVESSDGGAWRVDGVEILEIWNLTEDGVAGSQGNQGRGQPDEQDVWTPFVECAIEPRRVYRAFVEISAESDADGRRADVVSRSVVIFHAQLEHLDVTQVAGGQSYAEAHTGEAASIGAVGPSLGAASWSAERLDLFIGSPHGFGHDWHDSARPMGSWEAILGAEAGNGHGGGASACSWGPGRLDVVKVDEFGDLHHVWFDEQDGWGTWDNLGGNLDPDCEPAVAAWGPGRLDVVARLPSGHLAHRWFDAAHGWRPWEFPRVGEGYVIAGGWTIALSLCAPDVGRLVLGALSFGRVWVGRYQAGLGWSQLEEVFLGREIAAGHAQVAFLARAPKSVVAGALGQVPQPMEDHLDIFAVVNTDLGPHLGWFSGRRAPFDVQLTALPRASYRGVTAVSWEEGRFDVFLSVEEPVGDLYRIDRVEHLWKATDQQVFSRESLSLPH